MKWVILVILFNVHTGDVDGPYVEGVKGKPTEYSDSTSCLKALTDHGPVKPNDEGVVPLFECLQVGGKPTVKLIQRL